MSEGILHEEPGITIAYDEKPEALAPYFPSEIRADGTKNHGFLDLRDDPGLVQQIPEVVSSPGFQDVLIAINRSGSRLMSLGCERGYFDSTVPELPRYIGSYTTIVFRDFEKNREQSNLVDLAHRIADSFKEIPGREERPHILEMIAERLKLLFGVHDAWSLNLKMLAYGQNDADATTCFEWTAQRMAKAISSLS
ncbi:hypothetical protein [Bradyrhizobium sp. USDA 4508]